MTPLARFLLRYLPGPLVGAALVAAYAGMLATVVLAAGKPREQIIYADVRGR